MQKIKKAVIPAAGLGTRFLPATKAVPKELLPIVDVPTLQLIIEEAAASGIEEVLLVVSAEKAAIRHHFAPAPELEAFLHARGKEALRARIAPIPDIVRLSFIVQDAPLGLGHAVSLARKFADGDAIAVLLGDDVVAADPPALAQLIEVYEETGASVVGVQPVTPDRVHKYGIVDPAGPAENGRCRVGGLVEKPSRDEAPSDLAIMGRYVITPEIFDLLDAAQPGSGGEIQLTDALHTLAQQQAMTACIFSGERFDVGDQLGFIQANIAFGLARTDIGPALKQYIKDLAESLS